MKFRSVEKLNIAERATFVPTSEMTRNRYFVLGVNPTSNTVWLVVNVASSAERYVKFVVKPYSTCEVALLSVSHVMIALVGRATAATLKGGGTLTVVTTAAALFPLIISETADATTAVLVIVPVCVGVTMMVTVTVSLLAMEPRAQMTLLP